MKPRVAVRLEALAALSIALLGASACQPSAEELQATVTSIAADVLATRSAAPTPTATPPPFAVHVRPDGSGDYASLEDAVRNAPEGAAIFLEAGTYELKETLAVNRQVVLRGAGIDETVITGSGLATVARFSGAARFGAEDVTFRSEGGQSGDVVVVDGGEISLVGCRFTGATAGQGTAGAGLRLLGNATGIVRDCVADYNSVGILVAGQASPTLEWNLAGDNSTTGIAYEGAANGTASRNECANAQTGIVISGQAFPALYWNLCTDNSLSGIVYRDGAAGTASANECVYNGVHGITVSDLARPTLEGNLCTDNGGAGIFYNNEATGTASENSCYRNTYGIQVAGSASPDLRKNLCTANQEAGVLYADQSAGLAYMNECHDNGQYGMWVNVTAQPLLDDNVLYDNVEQDLLDQRP